MGKGIEGMGMDVGDPGDERTLYAYISAPKVKSKRGKSYFD